MARASRLERLAVALGGVAGEVDGKRLQPMALVRGKPRLDDPHLVYELKLDGARLIADLRDDDLALTYRTGRS
jgi:hypothetical protein